MSLLYPNVNKSFFSFTDNEVKAYWLGFIIADGHVSSSCLVIALSETDKEHLLKLVTLIGYPECSIYTSNHPVSKKPIVRFSVYGKNTVVKDLRSLGINQQKSFTQSLPFLDEDLLRHMIRGIFDGDGSVSIYDRSDCNAKKVSVSIVGGETLIQSIRQVLETKGIHTLFRKTKSVFELRLISKEEVIKFYHFLYDDSTIFLERKHDKYVEVLGIASLKKSRKKAGTSPRYEEYLKRKQRQSDLKDKLNNLSRGND